MSSANRAGNPIDARQRTVRERTKVELRRQFGGTG
jgi:hypothetical protein